MRVPPLFPGYSAAQAPTEYRASTRRVPRECQNTWPVIASLLRSTGSRSDNLRKYQTSTKRVQDEYRAPHSSARQPATDLTPHPIISKVQTLCLARRAILQNNIWYPSCNTIGPLLGTSWSTCLYSSCDTCCHTVIAPTPVCHFRAPKVLAQRAPSYPPADC